MPIEDTNRWNLRYQQDPRYIFKQTSSLLVDHVDLLPTSGLALDIAMGMGGNSKFLLRYGLRVIGVDISIVAVSKAKILSPSIQAVVADLNNFYIPERSFDVVLNLLYLQRNLWARLALSLKIGGTLFIECLTDKMLNNQVGIKRQYLLKSGELIQFFSSAELRKYIEVLFYNEGWQSSTSHPRAVASLIARRNA